MKTISVFLISVLAIYLLLNYSAYHWIKVSFQLRNRTLLLLRILIWIPLLSFPAGIALGNTREGIIAVAVAFFGNVWLGILFYLFWINLVTGIAVLLVRKWLSPERLNTFVPLLNPLRIGILLGLTGLCVAGFYSAQHPRIRSVDVALSRPNLKAPPLRIVQLSDLHLDEIKPEKWWNRIVDTTNRLKPDLILLTGDIFDSRGPDSGKFDAGFHRLSAPLGIAASTGNHDFYAGINRVHRKLQQYNIPLLRNQTVTIRGRLHLVAVDDPTARRITKTMPVPLATLTRDLSGDLPVILMNHQPIRLSEARTAGIDLQLSGHTHGGQMWPFNLFTGLMFPVQAGLETRGDFHVYVTRGVGWWGPPLRVAAPAEITLITVHA